MEIEKTSMGIIDSEVPQPRPFKGAEWKVVRRMIHTTADFELLDLVHFHPKAIDAGLDALRSGMRVVTDTQMAKAGIPMRRMKPLGVEVDCFMNDPRAAKIADANGTTRAYAGIDLALEGELPGIMVIGNAPTALMRLMERIKQGAPTTKLVVGMPVGFVNAAESKELLLAQDMLPYVTIKGRKGGSALAACVVNALAEIVLNKND